jgi:hypothetical protein
MAYNLYQVQMARAWAEVSECNSKSKAEPLDSSLQLQRLARSSATGVQLASMSGCIGDVRDGECARIKQPIRPCLISGPQGTGVACAASTHRHG